MTNSVNCPYCNEENTDLWELKMTDGECTEIDCGSCGKEFTICLSVQFDYQAHKKEQDKS